MIPEMTERSQKLRARVQEFMDEHVYPNEDLYYRQIDEAEDPLGLPANPERAESQGEGGGAVESVPARIR